MLEEFLVVIFWLVDESLVFLGPTILFNKHVKSFL